jgi:hypothetical protein
MEEDHAIEEKRRFRAEKKKRQAEKKALQAAADINAPPITHNDDSLSTSHPSTAKANYTLRHLKPVLKDSNSIHETTHHDGGTRSLQIMTWNVSTKKKFSNPNSGGKATTHKLTFMLPFTFARFCV